MSFLSWFFKILGKRNDDLGSDDGQAKYFKEDFNPKENGKSTKTVKNTTKNRTSKIESKIANDTKLEPKKQAEYLTDESPEVKGSHTVKESKSTKNGKFDIKKAKDGRYFFSLYASNGAVIAYSQLYSSINAVNIGIKSIIKNANKAKIEDTTLKNYTSLPCPKWEIYIDKAGEYRFRLYAINGLCVCHSSHGYASKSGCKGGIDSITRFASDAKVNKSYIKVNCK